MSSLDELLVDIGGFGRFQVLLTASTAFNTLCIGWSMLLMSYAGYIPDWHCNTVSSGYHGNLTLSRSNTTTEKCQVNNSWTNYQAIDCQDFQFDSPAVTVVTEWELVCDRKWIKSAFTSIQMAGVLLGAFLSGQVADRIGRKKCLYAYVLAHLVVNIVAAFSLTWQMFAVCRFLIGVGIGGILVVNIVYQLEFMPVKWRPARNLLPTWVTGVSIFAVFALALDNWSHLHIACGLFGLPGLTGFIFLPESLRWLTVHGRLKEAEEVCNKVASINRVNVPAKAKSILETIYQEEQEANERDGRYTYRDIFKGWEITKVTLTFSFFWFSMSLMYYGISFGVSSLAGNLYLNIFLVAVVEVPTTLTLIFVINKLGRKWTSFGYLIVGFLGACGCVIAHYTAPSEQRGAIVTGLSLVTKMGIGTAWAAIATWGLELYPTVTRNLGYGFANTAARVGGILAPFVIDFEDQVAVSYGLIGLLNFLCLLLCFVNPDTKGKVLEDTMGKERANQVASSTGVMKEEALANGKRKNGEVFTVHLDANVEKEEDETLENPEKFDNIRL